MVGGYCSKCKTQSEQVHRFPENKDRAYQWAANMLWVREFTELMNVRNATSTRGITICSRHFSTTSYNNNSRSDGLRYGAMPEVLIPVVTRDHEYMDVSHPQLQNTFSPELEGNQRNDALPPAISTESSKSSWNGAANCSQETNDVYIDQENSWEKRRRTEKEGSNMKELKNKNSIISHNSFLELLNFTPGCLKCRNIDAERSFKTIGCVLVMNVSCPNCKKWKWTSTGAVHDDNVGSFLEGNVNVSVATYASGIPYERAVDMFNILEIGLTRKASHYQIIREHAKPVIEEMYTEDADDVRQRLCARNNMLNNQIVPLSVIGDAQYDSRGFCAGICRYALLDNDTRFIIEHQIEARRDNDGNSPAMEAKALAKIMSRITSDNRLNIVQLTTDKNSGVVSHMKKAHPTIRHRLDKWHVLKNFKKNNKHAIDLKRNANLRAHWEHLLVHIWYSIEAADGDSDLAVELVRSAEYHLQDIHTLPKNEFTLIHHCTHGPILSNQDKAYLHPVRHKEQLRVLHNMLNSPTFLENVRVCAARETTIDKATTTTLMQLAILHHNGHRKEVLDKEALGLTPPTRRKYSKSQGRHVEVTNHPKPTLTWKVELLARVKEHYREMKSAQMKNRITGRPAHSTVPSIEEDVLSSDGLLDEDDVLLDELDGSDVEPEEDMDIDEELNQQNEGIDSNTPVSTTSVNYILPAVVKPIIRCSPRQFPLVYHAKGTNADLFRYINNRTGEEMLPIIHC